MLGEIGSMENVPAFIDGVKAGKGKLQGFGHRVYKNYDPRAKIVKATADQVFEITGKSDKVEQFIALMLPLGLVEVSRTGIAAIARGPEGM